MSQPMAPTAKPMMPLDPNEAVAMFYSGEMMCFVAAPTDPFACGQWMGKRAVVSPLPFTDATAAAYFTENPAMVYDPNVPPPPPSGGATAGAITAGTPYATAPKERKHGRAR